MEHLYNRGARLVLALAATVSLVSGCGRAAGSPSVSGPTAAFPAGQVQAQSAGALEAWKDQVIYFVLLDRFANGTQLTDALSGEPLRVENRTLRVVLKAKQARIYLAR